MGDVKKKQRFSIYFSERLEFSSRKCRQHLQIEQGGIIAMAFETAQIHFLWVGGVGFLSKIVRLRAVSLFSWSFEQNARDTQMITRVTEGARRERLKKKRDCSQSKSGNENFTAQKKFYWQLRRLKRTYVKMKNKK